MTTRQIVRAATGAVLIAGAISSTGCIIVADGHDDLARIERRKADAQYLAARAEIEKINLEREKAGLKRIEFDDKSSSRDPPSDPELSK
jgi:hypothetical protein